MRGPLKDARQEAFCQNSAKLMSDVQAYKKAYKCTLKTAMANAWRVRELEGVKARILELQNRSASKATMDVTERREIATEIARDKTVDASTRLNATVVEAKHAGEYMDRADLTSDGQALPSVLPAISFVVPDHYVQRRGQKREE